MRRSPSPDFLVAPTVRAARRFAGDALHDDELIEDTDFADADLSGGRAHLVDLVGCCWSGASLAGTTTTKLTATDQTFDQCDLALWRAEDASLSRIRFTDCRMAGVGWTGATAQQVEVVRGIGDFANLRFTKLKQVRFTECRLSDADFTSAIFDQVVFDACDLSRAEFHHVQVKHAWFVDCTFAATTGIASLRGAVIKLSDPLAGLDLLPALAAELGLRLGDPE